ncbi:DNA repair ATPase-related [Musa troglodytarum]|uniref:DNA repair ATPase-related n=1 Tax=Musa troglodytarum TaxID=320322 RepID=A0A9E7KAL0_9LILI|nr:DNA repair ATPase-related [Musa troglodytarum]
MMEASKLPIASIVICLVFVGAWADAGAEEEVVVQHLASDSALKLEVEQLRSKISVLEASILDRTRDLKSKDETITHLEMIIEEKSKTLLSLQSEIESVQKGAGDAEELVKKAHARADELEKQMEKLRNDIELQNKRRVALDAQAGETEKKVGELNLKLENLQKINDEQKRRIQKTERALHVAEEELMRAQLEATAKSKELSQARGAWLPRWFAAHINRYLELATTYWKHHAKPTLDVFLHKALEKSAQAQKRMEPHLEMAKNKWIPAIKERWVILATNAEPYVHTFSAKAIEVYHTSKDAIATHVVKVQKLGGPYFQAAKRFSKPYIDQVATITKPHVNKVQVALKPYKKRIVRAYRMFHKSATVYHHQVQAGIHEHLKKYELTKALATKELVWFMASALLALPIFLVYKFLSDIFCSKTTRKPTRNAHGNHTHRRPKRRLADK